MYEREKEFTINYKQHILTRKFYADFYVMDKTIVEVNLPKKDYQMNMLHKP